MSFTEKFNARYSTKQFGDLSKNLPQNGIKKSILSECYSCKHYEQWDNNRDLHWCVSKYFDRIENRQVTRYQNIEFLETCPKMDQKR